MKKQFRYASSGWALSTSMVALCACAAPALAQTAAPASVEDSGLNTIVVTASKGDKTQLKSSVAVTSISNQAIEDYAPRGEASLYRLIPGVLVQGVADSPGGNLNIAARGVPSYVGGAEYVQLQEDGLPIVLFGDMQFGNADYWIRNDLSNARVESQVGGRDSTFASQGPSAVINYISKTGDRDGGLVKLEEGVNFDQSRLDFDYGGHVNDSLRFNIGGFVKDGHDPRRTLVLHLPVSPLRMMVRSRLPFLSTISFLIFGRICSIVSRYKRRPFTSDALAYSAATSVKRAASPWAVLILVSL